jgi:hypothetical protein
MIHWEELAAVNCVAGIISLLLRMRLGPRRNSPLFLELGFSKTWLKIFYLPDLRHAQCALPLRMEAEWPQQVARSLSIDLILIITASEVQLVIMRK